ncbi:MAG: ABC transporter permease [Chloroflexi bacterium]|nr:ABC transporter permease [Chloroflexota bacterium]
MADVDRSSARPLGAAIEAALPALREEGGGAAPLALAAAPSELREQLIANALRVGGLAALIALWAVGAALLNMRFLPGPLAVFEAMVGIVLSGEFLVHMWHTIYRVVLGFLLAFAAATVLGIAMGAYRRVENLFDFEVLIGLTVPGLCWGIIALIVFGLNELSAISAVFVGVLPILTLNMWEGTKALDKDLIEMAHAFRISRVSIIRWVVLPQLIPYLFAAIRLGLSIAWKLIVVVEMFGLSNGIGYMLNYNFGVFSMAGVLAWTFSFTLVMVVIEFVVLRRIEHRVTRWRPAISL